MNWMTILFVQLENYYNIEKYVEYTIIIYLLIIYYDEYKFKG